MILSMTGFGSASEHTPAAHYAAEVRSVNNRFLQARVRLPDVLAPLEAKIEQRIKAAVGRGGVTCTLHLKTDDAAGALHVNEAVLDAYLAPLRRVAGGMPIDVAGLMTLPGVLVDPAAESEPDAGVEAHEAAVLAVVDAALDRHRAARLAEGRALHAELTRHLDGIAADLDAVAAGAADVVKLYHRRLTARVNELIGTAELKVSEGDLIREVAVFAEKADIAEEIARLRHHVESFRQALDEEGQVGRKLDFLTQEMLREANTIGSKTPDAAIAGHVVEIKGAIDRLKEQVQNVE